jgi:hypothetical protein
MGKGPLKAELLTDFKKTSVQLGHHTSTKEYTTEFKQNFGPKSVTEDLKAVSSKPNNEPYKFNYGSIDESLNKKRNTLAFIGQGGL